MAGATGLEPATSGVTGRRSNQLSYAPAASTRGGHSYPLRLEGVKQSSVESSGAAVRAEKPAPRPFDQLKSPPCIDAKSTFQCSEITTQARTIAFDRAEARGHFVEFALRAVAAFVLSREACPEEIEKLGILGD